MRDPNRSAGSDGNPPFIQNVMGRVVWLSGKISRQWVGWMNDIRVLNRFAELEAVAEGKGLTLTFTGEEFLVRSPDSQLWAHCASLSEVDAAVAAYAPSFCGFSRIRLRCPQAVECASRPPSWISPMPPALCPKLGSP